MSDTYRHKQKGKASQYNLEMRQWYKEGTLYSDYPSWPRFLFGPEPFWWLNINSDKQYDQYLAKLRRRTEDRKAIQEGLHQYEDQRWVAVKKDRRRWCRGRAGRYHLPHWERKVICGNAYWSLRRCIFCHKILGYRNTERPLVVG